MPNATYTNIKKEEKENSQVEITGEIPALTISEFRVKALKKITADIELPGFRKGHAPEKLIVERVGEMAILEEAAEMVLQVAVPEIIEENVPDYIGRPQISITKLAPNNPMEFKVLISKIPDFKLPEYKKIAASEMSKTDEKIEVTDKEIDDVIEEVRKQRAHVELHKNQEAEKPEGPAQITSEPDGKNSHNHGDEELAKHKPDFNDEFVKTLGDFKDVPDFRAKVKENMTKEKEHKNIEKRRGKILEEIIEKTKIVVPQILIDNELERMSAQFENDIAGIGLKVDDYLKHLNKTRDDIKKEWLPDAEKRAKLNLILEKIAKEEKIVADKEAVEHEVKHVLEHYKDQNVDPLRVRLYVEHTLTIEKVIKFLEEQK
jgi:trigger factor